MAAPALAASIHEAAICAGLTGTAGFFPGESAEPVTAHEIITLRCMFPTGNGRDVQHSRVFGGAKVEALRGRNEIALGVDDLDEVAAVIPGTADVALELHRMCGASQRPVELCLQLVPHDEVRRHRREHDDDCDDSRRHESQAGAKRHGSRST